MVYAASVPKASPSRRLPDQSDQSQSRCLGSLVHLDTIMNIMNMNSRKEKPLVGDEQVKYKVV